MHLQFGTCARCSESLVRCLRCAAVRQDGVAKEPAVLGAELSQIMDVTTPKKSGAGGWRSWLSPCETKRIDTFRQLANNDFFKSQDISRRA